MFKLNIQGVLELCANYLIDILEIVEVKSRFFQFLTSDIRMESTIRTGGKNGRKSVAEEMEISV